MSFLDTGPWIGDEFYRWRRNALEQFTRETGIDVELRLQPESSRSQLALCRKMLEGHLPTPDVYAIDVIWPGTLAEHFIDLNPALAQQASEHFPAMIANNTVAGKLVALPYHTNAGLLFYRTDLLREYGYRAPPATWDELEAMALRIQEGERAKGKSFWGFVWQGVADESLTCNGLEWQASEGGGHIIEPDRTISISNPRAVEALERAAHWLGTISPPAVITYREADALNWWQSGRAAFMRNWPHAYSASQAPESAVRDRFDVTFLPAGRGGHAQTLGGFGLAVSRYSPRPREAVALVGYLCRRDVQLARSRVTSLPPTIAELYDDPGVLRANPHFRVLKGIFRGATVARPSTAAGSNYADVSQAYYNAVHSVLLGERRAADAVVDLQGRLVKITGLRTGPPAAAQ